MDVMRSTLRRVPGAVTLAVCTLVALPALAAGAGVGGVKFRNTADRPMRLFWKSHTGVPDAAGRVPGDGGQTGFMTYETHKFFWSEDTASPPAPTSAEGSQFVEFEITKDQKMYYYMDNTTKPDVRKALEDELTFMQKYEADTGRSWVGTTWPRPAPTWEMWQPTRIGQIIVIPLSDHPDAGRYECDVYAPGGNVTDCLEAPGSPKLNPAVTRLVPITEITVSVVSLTPKAFRIVDFLSDFEADYMVQQAAPMLGQSTVGHGGDARLSNVRSSKSAWLHRGHSAVLEAIYTRIGLVTRTPDHAMRGASVESINVLRYGVGAEYAPHFDWGADGRVESRFITSLMYLNTPEEGGATSFPKAEMPDGTIGAEVPAIKKQLMFFYNLLEDGNADELSLHAGTPVKKGVKWTAPLWIWEPFRR